MRDKPFPSGPSTSPIDPNSPSLDPNLPTPSPATNGSRERDPNEGGFPLRTSAALVLVAILLFAAQLGFSDGAQPRIAPLPIGMVPVTAGVILLLAGLAWGLIAGNGGYRLAVGVALLGTALTSFGLMFATVGGGFGGRRPDVSVNEIAFALGVLVWLVAVVFGARSLRAAALRP
jgi:hypothetical protein